MNQPSHPSQLPHAQRGAATLATALSIGLATLLAPATAAQQVTPYGCGVNEPGSLTVLSGEPSLSKTIEFGLDNPCCSQADSTFTFLLIDAAPAANYPCGIESAEWAMCGSSGELLVSLADLQTIVTGPLWSCGAPVSVDITVPASLIGLVGATVYAQGLFVDVSPSGQHPTALTDALEIEIGPTPEPLAFGDSISGTISPASEVDVYEFTALAGDELYVPFVRTTGASFSLELVVSKPNQPPLTSVSGNSGILEFTVPETGDYLLSVSNPSNIAGNYLLTMQRTVDPGNVVLIDFGQTVSATTSPATDIDVFRFDANDGDELFLPFVRKTGAAFTLSLELRDSGTGQIVSSTSGNSGVFETAPLAAGTYDLWVRNPNLGLAGNYEFTLENSNSPANPAPLNVGDSVSATIGAATEIDVFELSGAAGDDIFLPFVRRTGASFTLQLDLRDSSGSIVTEIGGNSGILQHELLADGTYYLWVRNPSLSIAGNYEFTHQLENAPAGKEAINLSEAFTGTISPGTEIDILCFDVPGPTNVCIDYVRLTGASFTLEVVLRDSQGVEIASSSGNSGELNTFLDAAGTYSLWVRNPSLGIAGNYEVQVDLSFFPCP